MDTRTQKLAIKLKDPDLAERLTGAGYHNPALIRAASDDDLKRIKGIGTATVKGLREKIG